MTMLILGGARSGKSRFAEMQAVGRGLPVICIATARRGDAEMEARIARHRAARPSGWTTVEEPIRLGDAITEHSTPDTTVVVDCLTLWLANVLFDGGVEAWAGGPQALPPVFVREYGHLLTAVARAAGPVFLVSNEVGQGIVPLGAGNRLFVDEAGRMHQQLAALCNDVVYLVAGLPQWLKREAV